MPRSHISNSIQEQVEVLDDSDVWVTTVNGAAAADSASSSNAAAATVNNNTVGHALRDLEEQLRCGICCNFFRSPVLVVPCSHTFCSACVRAKFRSNQNSTAQKVSCPACNEGVDPGGVEFRKCLVPNRAVDNLVRQFRLLRQPLLTQLRQQQQQQQQQPTDSDHASRDDTPAPVENHDDASQQKPNGEKEQQEYPRRSARCAKAKLNKTQYDKVASESPVKMEVQDSKPAAAAISNQPGAAEQLQVAELPPELEQRRKKLPRALYKGLKKKDLQALCRKHRLQESGSEKDLKDRHCAWIDKYNAECDSLLPRPVEDLRKELVTEEHDKKFAALASGNELARVAKLFASLTRLGKTEANWTGIPSSGDKKFDELLAENFDELILSHRARYPGLGMRRRSLADIEAVMEEKEQQLASATVQRNGESEEKAHIPVGQQVAATPEHEEVAPRNDAAAKKSSAPSVPGRAANPSNDRAKLDNSGVNNPYAGSFESAAPALKNPYSQGRSSNGSTASINIHASAPQQNFDSASKDVGVSAGLRGMKIPSASVASAAQKPAPADSDPCNEGQNATGLSASFDSKASRSSDLLSAKNQAEGHFFGSHLRTQQPESKPASQHQSVSSSLSDEKSLSRQGGHAAAKATKRKSPKQSQLYLAFTSKPKKQRSLLELKKPADEHSSSSSLFGPSWKCTFCVSDNKKNPGSRAKCATCGGCRQCGLRPCICRESESSSQETLCIDC